MKVVVTVAHLCEDIQSWFALARKKSIIVGKKGKHDLPLCESISGQSPPPQ